MLNKKNKKPVVTTKKEEKKQVIYPIIELEGNGQLILPDHIVTQINYLHGKVGKEEWSGMLLYDVISGTPAKPDGFVLEAKHIFLMDIGTAAYTEYETDGDIVDIYDNLEDAMEWKTGHIHTHHDMGTFFSGTDMSELNDNVDKHNYYLSLIVNFAGTFSAKVAFLSDTDNSELNFIDDSGKRQNFKVPNPLKNMVTIEMDIYYGMKDDFFYNRYHQVVKKIEAAAKAKAAAVSKKWGKGSYHNGHLGGSSQLDEIEFNTLPALRGVGATDSTDAKELTDREVERLARNVIGVTADMSELRSVYSVLFTLSKAKSSEMEYYYTYLADNVGSVIEAFFDQELQSDEMDAVLTEISASMLRYQAIPAIVEVVKGINTVLSEFGLAFRTSESEEELEDQLEFETLQNDMM